MPRFRVLASLGAVACLASGAASAADMPPQLKNAQYVLIGFDQGTRFLSASDAIGRHHELTEADRDALERVHDLVEGWDRFVIVRKESEADLVFAVRAGRRASLDIGIGIGRPDSRTGGGDGSGWNAQAEAGTTDDMLIVYEAGRYDGPPLWRGHAPEGLSGDVPLFQAFRDELEAAFP